MCHCYCFLCWQMLLPRWLMVLPCFIIGRCYCHVADVFATVFCSYNSRCYCLVADGMPTMGMDGRCYSQGGRLIGHWVNVSVLILMFCVGPHPICEADGTCLCSCLGMGHCPLWIEPLLLLWWGSGPPFQL